MSLLIANQRVRRLFSCAALAGGLLAGCGGSSDAPPPVAGPPPAPAPTPLPPVATRVVVAPAGMVLRPGELGTLTAQVYDQNGALMTGQAVRWTSSNATVAIGSDGQVTAGAEIDSSQITARVGTAVSQPVTAMVAQTVAGARLVPDAEVLVDPAPIDAAQTGLPGSRFAVRLGGAAPTVGQVILASGGKRVAGRVVSTTAAAGGGNDVVFETAGLAEIFEQAKIVTRFEGASLPVEFPSGDPVSETVLPSGEVSRLFTINVPVTTQASGARPNAGTRKTAAAKLPAAATEFKVGPLRCKANGGAAPDFGGTAVNVTPTGTLGVVESTFIVDGGAAYAKVLAEGSFGVTLQGKLRVSGQLSGDVKCSATLVSVRIPVPPQVALIVQPVVPLGFRVAVNGQINSPGLEVTVDSSVRQSIRAGFELQPDGTLENLSSVDSTQLETSFNWDITADPGTPGFRFEAEARAGLFADAALTNPFLALIAPALDIDPNLRLLEGFAGFNAVARLKPVAAQLASPSEPSLYNIKFRASVGTSDTVNRALAMIGAAVGASSIANPEIRWEPTLVGSPQGGGLASLRKFEVGDKVGLGVRLVPDTVKASFLGTEILPYNVKRVEVWRKEAGGTATKVASIDATSGQTSFTNNWTADQEGELNGKYYAFVVPLVGQSFPLLLGEVLGWQGVVQVGANGRDDARGFGWDDNGRVYMAVSTSSGGSYFDPATGAQVNLAQYGGLDAQVLRYNPIGSLTSALSFGGPGDDVPIQMRRAADGTLYAIGTSTASQTGGTTGGYLSAWIARIDVSGVAPRLLWRRQIGVRNEFAFGMDFGSDGSVYTVSTVSGARANVGGTAFGLACGDQLAGNGGADDLADCGDVVVTRMTADGEVIWRSVDARPGWQREPSIAVRGTTAYVISGTFCEIEDASVTGARGPCVTNDWLNPEDQRRYELQMIGVSRIAAGGGAFTHLKSIKAINAGPVVPGAPEVQMSVAAFTLVLDNAGKPLIAGQLRRAEAGSLAGTNANPYFLAGLNDTGEPAWVRSYGDAATVRTLAAVRGLVQAADGGFYATFAATGSLYAPSSGGTDVVVLKLAADGTEQWGVQYGSGGDERAHGVDLDTYGNVFVYGNTTGGFGLGLSGGFGERDAFWLKLSPRGRLQSAPDDRASAKSGAHLPRLSIR
jgi:hypothetical protein